MHRSKIIRILKTFGEKEWRACHKYLKYSSQKEAKSLQIFEYLFKLRKNLDSPKLNRSRILKKLFSGLDEKTFLNRLSDLVKDVERFMIHDDLLHSENLFEYKLVLSGQYKRRGLYKDFLKEINQLDRTLAMETSLDLFRDFKQLQIHHALYFSDYNDQNLKPIQSLIEVEKRRRLFSENLKLFYLTETENAKTLRKIEYLDTTEHVEDQLNVLLQHFHALVTDKNDASYWFLSEYVLDHHINLSLELIQAFILALINHSFYRIKEGHNSFMNNLSKLYLFGLDKDILLHNGKLSETRFLNIVDVVSHSDIALDFEKFIGQNIDKIVTDDKVSVKNVALAMQAFATEDYLKTIEILNASSIYMTRLNYTLRSRWMQVCSLCSLYPNHEQKEGVLRAADIFFKRHKEQMNVHTFEGSINWLRVVRMFWFDRSFDEIKEFMSTNKLIVNRYWIKRMLKKRTQDSQSS